MSITIIAENSKPTPTPRRAKFERKPSPLARCIEIAGDVNAGVLFHQIIYRFNHKGTLPVHDGRSWVAQTADCWTVGSARSSRERPIVMVPSTLSAPSA